MKPDKPAQVLNIQKQSGWHLPVEIKEQEITFLVDSGASCTMIDASLDQNLTKSIPLQLSPIADTFVLADGSLLEVLGEVVFEGRIGDQWYPMNLVAAEFGDNTSILGLDFMEDQDVILRLSLGKMMIGNETVVLHRENAEKGYCRISLGNTLIIPARSCKVVEVEVDIEKSVDSGEAPRVCLVECLPTLADTNGIVIGSQLVELNQDKVLINLINVHDTPVSMNKGKTLGSMQPIRPVSLIESSAKTDIVKIFLL